MNTLSCKPGSYVNTSLCPSIKGPLDHVEQCDVNNIFHTSQVCMKLWKNMKLYTRNWQTSNKYKQKAAHFVTVTQTLAITTATGYINWNILVIHMLWLAGMLNTLGTFSLDSLEVIFIFYEKLKYLKKRSIIMYIII